MNQNCHIRQKSAKVTLVNKTGKDKLLNPLLIQYSSQVTSQVCALRGMQAREKLARAQGALEELRVKPNPLES